MLPGVLLCELRRLLGHNLWLCRMPPVLTLSQSKRRSVVRVQAQSRRALSSYRNGMFEKIWKERLPQRLGCLEKTQA